MLNHEGKRKLLGRNIAKYRKEKKLTQQLLAEKLNITREHLAKVETAKKNMSIDLLFSLSRVLDVPETNFFNFKN